MAYEPTFWGQLKAILIRNFHLKTRDKGRTSAEVLMPLYFIIILVVIRNAVDEVSFEEVSHPAGSSMVSDWWKNSTNEKIAYSPDTMYVRNVLDTAGKLISNMGGTKPQWTSYETERNLENIYNRELPFSKALVFNGDCSSRDPSYKIRLDEVAYPLPLEDRNRLYTTLGHCRDPYADDTSPQQPLPRGSNCLANEYYYSGFISLQQVIDIAIIQTCTGLTNLSVPEIKLQQFPKAKYIGNTEYLRSFVPLYLVLSFTPLVSCITVLIVDEKEKKIREGMKMMGLKDSVYWIGWFLSYSFMVVYLALFISILLVLAKVMANSSIILIFFSTFLYGLSTITIAYIITAFFSKAKVAGGFAGIMSILFSLLFYVTVYADNVDSSVYWFLSLISPTAFALGMDQAVYLDLVDGGLTFDNVWYGKGSYSFGASLVMLTIDVFLYAFIAYYLDNVIPGEYGRKRPPWFCFLPSFWKGTGTKWSKNSSKALSATMSDTNSGDCEEVPRQMMGRESIKVMGLKKTYTTHDGKEFNAVNGIHLDIYEGQITAILGHNGAGKSTLISMLVGLTSPSEGTAIVGGFDVRDRNNMEPIWQNMGVCLQQDTLFDTLTCREHLEFYARMKGVPSKKLCDRVELMLADVGLSDKADTKSIKLSGGQKRRLSVGIALVGEPKIVFLDEPSSGVDPYSRRQLWNLLQSKKQGRAIVLTTHFMDEADILADRKAIVSRGKLKCVGSSLFLKNRFGLGYHLSVVVDQRHNGSAIEKLIRESSARAKRVRETLAEITYLLPFEDVANFPELLGALDQKISVQPNDVGIRTYGVSMTTLEEVFLELGKKEDEAHRGRLGSGKAAGNRRGCVSRPMVNMAADALRRGSLADIEGGLPSFPVNPSCWKAYAAVTKLKLITTLRLPKSLIFTVVVPIVLITLGLTVLKFQEVEPVSTDPFKFSPDDYAPPPLLYNNLSGVDIKMLLNSVDKRMGYEMPVPYNKPYAGLLDVKPHVYYWQVEKYNTTNYGMTINVTYNDTALHSLPTLISLVSNVLLDQLASNLSGVYSSGHPLPPHDVTPAFNMYAMGAAMLVGITFIIVAGFLAVDLVEDRESRIRHLLQVNGLRFIAYWGSMIASHLAVYGISLIAMMVLILAFQINELNHPAALGTIFLIYGMYLMTGLLYSYCISFLFDRTDRAQSLMPFLTMMLGYIPYTAVTTLDRMNPDAQEAIETMHYVFTALFPVYTPFAAIYFVNKVQISKSVAGQTVDGSDYFIPPINAMLIAVPLQGILLGCLLVLLDVKSSGGRLRDLFGVGARAAPDDNNYDVIEKEDSDVKEERARVQLLCNNPDRSNAPVVAMQALRKEYPVEGFNIRCRMPWTNKDKPSRPKMPKVAVRNLTLAVDRGEVFGLLGPNGAGKTTALSMIVADRGATKGRIMIAGQDATTGLSSAYTHVGFCPQHDALWKNITVKEHIQCYAAIRGVSKSDIPKLVDSMLKGLQIEEHANKRSHTLSGGTKRKLSYAISMMGCPKAVLLDEPSTGMDPQSKRFLWNTILASFHGDRGAVLTTHSMEEADVLCSRIGIMVKGALRCLGSTQHLKNKYGSGYILEAKLASGRSMLELEAFLTGLFKTAKLQEKFEDRVKYQIPPTEKMPLAKVFAELQQAKQTIGIQEYSFSQTTLEQVFLDFARQQEYD